MSVWRVETGRSSSGSKGLTLIILMASTIASGTVSGAAPGASLPNAPNAPATSTASASAVTLPAGASPMVASQLFVLYRDKSWQWTDGAGRMSGKDRRFTAWIDGAKGKSWAEGRWLVTDAGLMCIKANWHSAEGIFPGKTCFAHRMASGTIYQKQEPDGAWYVFRHADGREDDEAKKLVSVDLVTARFESLRPVRGPEQLPTKPKAKE